MDTYTDAIKNLYDITEIREYFNFSKFAGFLCTNDIMPIPHETVSFKKNTYPLRETIHTGAEEDERVDTEFIYIIESGIATMEKDNIVLDIKASDDIVGFSDLFTFNSSNYSYKVISNAMTVVKFNKAHVVDKLLNTQEGYLYHYSYTLRERQNLEFKERIRREKAESKVILAVHHLLEKLNLLNLKISDLYTSFPITMVTLANYVHLNVNTVSTVLHNLMKLGVVKIDNKQIFVNLEKIEAYIVDIDRHY
ncbi:Crp/Fnr family transcriptional regulator [Listeria rocourtiae]|uniref:Crp/Fnr family transcriptional regulator n=1 Tax=Listeria rocourtiae TaxID=647910 RepID=UPI001624A986|nr:Crp/Fnr family transcriptional regulator [Listeria rocourtiae]MBC1605517.1 Crp/Fnr family transcriptional regulator [Listeria rocourtiae]